MNLLTRSMFLCLLCAPHKIVIYKRMKNIRFFCSSSNLVTTTLKTLHLLYPHSLTHFLPPTFSHLIPPFHRIKQMTISSGFIAFFGATGGCANAALVHTLNAGLHATALARTPSKLTEMLIAQGIKQATLDTHLTIVQGDVTNVPDVKSALLSKDHTLATQIIFGIGGAATMKMSLKQPILMDNPEICTVAAKTIVEALHEIYTEHPSTANSKPTILVISTTGLSDVKQDVPFGLRTLYHVVLAVPHKDKKLMENLVVEEAVGQKTFRASIVVRASLMTGDQDVKSGKGYKKLKVGTEEKPALGYSIRRADVGEWIFAETIRTGGESYYNQKVTLTN